MKKTIIFIIAVGLLSSFLFSAAYTGKGKLKGVVKDENGNPIGGVTVKLFSLKAASGFNIITNKEGEWKALWIRSGMWYIDFEKPGYEPHKISVDVSSYKKNPLIEVVLKKMEGVEISKDFLIKILVHGFLHLVGFSHDSPKKEKIMKEKEEEITKKLIKETFYEKDSGQ